MADVAISGLPAVETVAGANLVPIVADGVTSKATVTQVITAAAPTIAVSLEVPQSLGVAAAGSSGYAARVNHVHAHGDQTGGSLHATATTLTAGFLSAVDKTKLDGLAGSVVDPAITEAGFDDFTEKIPNAWSIVTTTGGSVLQGASAAAYSYPGAGIVGLAVDGTGGAVAKLRRATTGLVFGVNPISVTARVMCGAAGLPADDECAWLVGVASDDTLTNLVGVGALWSLGVRSYAILVQVGGVVTGTTAISLPTLAAGEMYALRLDVDATGARAYYRVNNGTETLVGTSVTVPAQAVYSPVLLIDRDTGVGGRTILCDYVSWSADRYTALADAGAPTGTELPLVEIPAALTSSAPADVASVAAVGTGTTAARSNHVHAHGNRAGGSLHAAAVASVSAGFMSSSDKAKLDGIAAGATVAPALASTTPAAVGTAAIGVGTTTARADHVHAHGDQLGGTLHADAGASSGFMSAAQVTKLAGIASGATVAPALASTTPEAVGTAAVGTGTTTARADHVHGHGDQLGGSLHAAASASAAGFLSSYDADLSFSRLNAFRYVDDFHTNVVSSQNGVHVATVSGTGALFSTLSGEPVPGVCSIATGTTTTGRAAISPPLIAFLAWSKGSQKYDAILRMWLLSDGTETYTVTVGMSGSVGATIPAIGAYFYYDHTVSANWLCRTVNSGAPQSTDSGVPVSTSYQRLSIRMNAAGTSVAFYVNGSLVATHTGTLPSTSTGMSGCISIIKSAGTTSRAVFVDLVAYEATLITARPAGV